MSTYSFNRARIILLCVVLMFGAGAAYSTTNVNLSISFHDVLAPYGTWMSVSHYGTCWRPRVSTGWRPFTYGHWEYASVGPTWVGYEPWTWCAEHYGHWVFTTDFGWIWVPGYEWSPAPVEWSYGTGYIGWRPAYPPGYATYQGYGGANVNLWVVINSNHFGYSNYSGYALRQDTVRTLFARQAVRISSAPLRREEMERVIHRPIRVVSVSEREIEADHHKVRLVVPVTQESTVISHISRFSKKSEAQPAVHKVDVEKKSPVQASHHTLVPESKTTAHQPVIETSKKTTTTDHDKPSQANQVTPDHHASANQVDSPKKQTTGKSHHSSNQHHGSSKSKPHPH